MTGTCSVCGWTGDLTEDGKPPVHERTIVHREADEYGPAVETTSECRGSRRAAIVEV